MAALIHSTVQKIQVKYIGLQTAYCADGIVKDSVEVPCQLLIITTLTAHGQPRYLGGQIHRFAPSKQQVAPSFCISVPCTQWNDVTDAHQREHGSCSIQCSLQHESSCQLYQRVTYEQVQFQAQNRCLIQLVPGSRCKLEAVCRQQHKQVGHLHFAICELWLCKGAAEGLQKKVVASSCSAEVWLGEVVSLGGYVTQACLLGPDTSAMHARRVQSELRR